MSSSCSWSGPVSTKTSASILMSSSSISINGFSSSHWAWATGIQVFLLRICRADRFWHIGSQRYLIHLSTNSVHTIWKISWCHCLLMIQTITQPSSASYFSYFSVTNALNGLFQLTFGTWMYFVLPQEAILVSTFFLHEVKIWRSLPCGTCKNPKLNLDGEKMKKKFFNPDLS